MLASRESRVLAKKAGDSSRRYEDWRALYNEFRANGCAHDDGHETHEGCARVRAKPKMRARIVVEPVEEEAAAEDASRNLMCVDRKCLTTAFRRCRSSRCCTQSLRRRRRGRRRNRGGRSRRAGRAK